MTEPNPEFTAALLNVLAMMAPLREACVGYRRQLLDEGVSCDAADNMAADLHRLIVHQMIAGQQ